MQAPPPRPPTGRTKTRRLRARNQEDEVALEEIVNDLREYSSQDKTGQPLIFAGESIAKDDEKGHQSRTPDVTGEYFEDNIACSHYLHEHLRAVWFAPDLKQRMCYYCAENATDRGQRLVGGLPQLKKSRGWIQLTSLEDVVYKLNVGEEMMVNLSKLKCPCGTPFRNSTQSAFCSMCCTATCSAACHKVFCQDAGMCFYHLNYIFETQSDIYGCRDIRWCVIERSTPGTYLSRVCGPRYLEAIMVMVVAFSWLTGLQGKDVMSLIVRRGYCQYGQPLDSTISAFMPLPKDVQRLPNPFRLNICTCKVCSNRQPHAACHSICPFLHPVPVTF